MAIWGMRCINLNNVTLRTITYSTSIENMGNEKPYTRRKNIAISKIVFQSFITTVPKHIVNELKKGFFME